MSTASTLQVVTPPPPTPCLGYSTDNYLFRKKIYCHITCMSTIWTSAMGFTVVNPSVCANKLSLICNQFLCKSFDVHCLHKLLCLILFSKTPTGSWCHRWHYWWHDNQSHDATKMATMISKVLDASLNYTWFSHTLYCHGYHSFWRDARIKLVELSGCGPIKREADQVSLVYCS